MWRDIIAPSVSVVPVKSSRGSDDTLDCKDYNMKSYNSMYKLV